MRQMAFPRGESGAKSAFSTAATSIPSSLARAARRRGVRSVRVMPGCTQFTVMPKRPSWTARVLLMCTSDVLRAPPLRLPALRALRPLMLMMRPQRCSFMNGMAARAQRTAPTYFTSKSCRRSSSTRFSMGPTALGEPPGGEPELTRIWSPPSCAAACATMPSTWVRLVTSAGMAMTRRPVSVASSPAAASSTSLVRDTIATSAPSRASSRAMALPMPRLPPVTMAFLPLSPRSMACLPLCLRVLEPEALTLAHHAAERGRWEVRGADQHVALAVALEEGAPRGRRLRRIVVRARHPLGFQALHRGVDEVAGDHRLHAPRADVHAHVIGRMPGGGLEADLVADGEVVLHQLGAPLLDDGEDAVLDLV